MDEFKQMLVGLSGALGVSAVARMLVHHKLVKLGKRRLWSWDLAWEIPTCVLMAIVGGGVAEFMGLDGMKANACVGVVAYLGPKGLETLVATAAAKWSKG